jgi:hypothetical protein
MAKALRGLKGIQISNPEDTPGTAEAAVEILCGVYSIALGDKVLHMPDQDKRSLSRNQSNSFVVGKEATGSIEGELNHRQIIWMLSNAIRGNVTPTQPAATLQPNAYLWAFEPGLTTGNTPDITNGIDTFTMEFGDNVQAYEMEYTYTTSLEISGAPNEPINFTWEITGRQITATTFTAALPDITVQFFPLNLAKFYIDTSYAGIGGTQQDCMLRAFTWTLETMFTSRFCANGSQVFSGVNEDKKKVDLELTYYRDALSEAERAKYDAQTTTYLRIAIEGGTELDVGQSNVPYIHLDGAFRYTEWPETDDEDGVLTVSVTAESQYDATGGKEFEVNVLTDLDAFPV